MHLQGSWNDSAGQWQGIRNAVEIPPLDMQTDAPDPPRITARIAWERDGVELVDTVALGWTSCAVRVALRDDRWRLGAVWVPAPDVRRR